MITMTLGRREHQSRAEREVASPVSRAQSRAESEVTSLVSRAERDVASPFAAEFEALPIGTHTLSLRVVWTLMHVFHTTTSTTCTSK